ncbi:permease for cytosine/purines, uracil, thiamine, allantoin-domain-containing protein [Mycena sp. CBHHK59/15]|nr:permease for cytosine/purines, uracil, thiamine, allantoin-domain-containing protein [Mycena sp. CBHHK59/15]
MPSQLLQRVNDAVKLHGNVGKHGTRMHSSIATLFLFLRRGYLLTIPLPNIESDPCDALGCSPIFFGYWTLGSLNASPATSFWAPSPACSVSGPWSHSSARRHGRLPEDLWRDLLEPAGPADAHDGHGHGSAKARAGVLFLALRFTLTSGFENIYGNAVAGGIDLSDMFPKYINIRCGALVTFMAVWIGQPWQCVNQATMFLTVISSLSVFLLPIMGIMCEFFVLRRQRIKLTDLYELRGSFYFWYGFNWCAGSAWVAGWALTVGGLWATAGFTPTRCARCSSSITCPSSSVRTLPVYLRTRQVTSVWQRARVFHIGYRRLSYSTH